MDAATCSQASCLRLDTITCAPCAASSRAMPSPMPRLAPVTRAILPDRSNGLLVFMASPWDAVLAVGDGLLVAQQFEVGVAVHGAQRHMAGPEQQPGDGGIDQGPVELGHALVGQSQQVLAQGGDGAA